MTEKKNESQMPSERPARAPRKRATESAPAKGGDTASGIRLNVFLQERGVASRRKADELIRAGQVSVNGKIVKELGTRIAPDARVTVGGKPVARAIPLSTYILHKPDLCLTSRSDTAGRPTVFDLPAVRKLPENIQAVGRLDFRSEGLLVLTNDGDMAYALTHPRYSVEKTYAVLLASPIAADQMDALRTGVDLEDGPAKALTVRKGARQEMGKGNKGQWVEVVVTEGRNRLVRRMFDALGHKVVRLVRTAIGDLELPMDLKPGQVRPVTGRQLKDLQDLRDAMLSKASSKRRKPARPAEQAHEPRRPSRPPSRKPRKPAGEGVRDSRPQKPGSRVARRPKD